MGTIGWLIAFLVLIGIEIATLALTTIWFAGGALVALLLSLFGVNLELQLLAFVIVSFLLLFLTRPLALQYFNKTTEPTNAEGLIGKQARITQQVDNAEGVGTAVLNGQEWTARAYRDGEILPVGMLVQVREIDGVKLMVEPIEKGEL